jgi:hypothetical protein
MPFAKQQSVKINGHPSVILSQTGGKGGAFNSAGDHSEYVLSHPDHAHSVGAHEMMLTFLEQDGAEGCSVLELFGGSGWLSMQIQRHLKPAHHEVWDLSPWCVATIQANAPDAKALVRDSYNDPIPDVDWIDCDYNNFTLTRINKPGPGRTLFGQVFKHAQRYVTIADVALYGTKRWQKNLDCYAKMYGTELEDWKAYYDLMADIVHEAFGFGLVAVIIKKGWRCANLVFKKGAEPLGSRGIMICRASAKIEVGALVDGVHVNLPTGLNEQ